MATVYKQVNGKPIEDFIGGDLDVQVAIGGYAFEIKAYADANLIEARDFSASIGRKFKGDSFVEVTKDPGKGQEAGWDVVLNDDRGDHAAYNIEKGRLVEFFDKVTGLPKGAMAALDILENAVQTVADRHRSELRGG